MYYNLTLNHLIYKNKMQTWLHGIAVGSPRSPDLDGEAIKRAAEEIRVYKEPLPSTMSPD